MAKEKKKCSRCEQFLYLSEFNRQATTSDGHHRWCRHCQRLYNLAYVAAHPEERKAAKLAWRKHNPEKIRRWNSQWIAANRERYLELLRQWSTRNPDKRRISWRKSNKKNRLARNAADRVRRCANLAKDAAKVMARHARKLKATPKWANFEQIETYYRLAAESSTRTGIQHHVDHIIPLRGKTVCGLHVQDNLQVIPAKQNLAKQNRFEAA